MSEYSFTELSVRELSHTESFTIESRSQAASTTQESLAEDDRSDERRNRKKSKKRWPSRTRFDSRGRQVLVRRYAKENQPDYIEQRRREQAAQAEQPPIIDFDAEDAAAERAERKKQKKLNKKGLASLFRRMWKGRKLNREGEEEQSEAASQAQSEISRQDQN
ncbi:hypothetical protein KEM56_000987 [Ascosphaera pollenicola]|nr:hypothetical protein KEM56_000987 [Ascosphaera pollenicola]